LKSITEDTEESQVSDVNGASTHGGLRARLERYERSAGGGIQIPVDTPGTGSETDSLPPSATGAEEPISPELVLVDPELGGRARALLPDPGPFTVPARTEPPPDLEPEFDPEANRVVLPESHTGAEPVPLPQPGRRSRKRRAATYALALIIVAVAAATVWYGGLRDRFSSQSGEDNVAPRAADNTPPANPPAKKAPPSPKPSAPTTSPRAFSWAPVRGAGSYLVQVYRGRTEIFRARPTEARVVVPAHWSYEGHRLTLKPGRYRWSVRPRLGGQAGQHYGKPIVLSELVVQRSSSGGGQSTRSP
jgi:hypothetical protein